MKRSQLLRILPLFILAAIVLAGAVVFTRWDENLNLRQTDTLRRVVILYTNDEHGYIEATDQAGGAAGLGRLWRSREGLGKAGDLLVLSGGDLWTGPAVSTLLDGESSIAVMNELGYQAAALGNHDFDFGVETVRRRAEQALFPFLAANLKEQTTGNFPEFARPFTVIEVNGVQVGVIGLTTIETPYDTRPAHVAGLQVLPYEQALRQVVPDVRAAGAELLVVAGHLCESEMRSLASAAAELGVAVIGGGHCHEEVSERAGEVILVQSGSFLQAYNRVELYYDQQTGKVAASEIDLVRNPPGRGDAALSEQVEGWQERAAQVYPGLYDPLGFLKDGIGRRTDAMASLLTRSWLEAYPAAQVALASPRYVQRPLPAGPLTPDDLIEVLPTRNTLVQIELTGAQLLELIERHQPLVGGLEPVEAGYRLSSGQPLDPETRLNVLLPVSLYEGGGLYDVQAYDPQGLDTGLDWRETVISWLKAQNTSRQRPLDELLE